MCTPISVTAMGALPSVGMMLPYILGAAALMLVSAWSFVSSKVENISKVPMSE
ncbi:hypothetical protein Metvu_0466 [Methanocaldococcus vulcanius M7]|uniref:Uncharacterized protein n=1 Tax=Methanocaldococcus vulcanius (strain ATCC 700851 / DSM 12094 / M7) TaxID=579137 RepID=C9RFH3_METVM|nr:hypothetical protein [Methanocaldococcus vulcanius]ACX72325.1 hypothetical protein Metvu_0466 [Methanocaldococcus vulcanius M7]